MEKVSGVLVTIMQKNVVIFGVDNSSSSHTDNQKNGFLILGDGPTFGINGSFGASESNFHFKSKEKMLLKFALQW